MLYYKIFTEKNVDAVNAMINTFGTTGDRKNKILLASLKDGALSFNLRSSFRSLEDVYKGVMGVMGITLDDGGFCFYSPDYRLDGFKGICEDGDMGAIRYARRDNDKVYKMKAGKFFRKLVSSCKDLSGVSEQVAAYCAEEFARRWEVYAANNGPDIYELVVDDDFREIYNGSRCIGSFGSCMTDRGNYTFYSDAIEAHAASLRRRDDDMIVARCIVYDRVRDDESNKEYRLAERQYASDGDERLKRLLVDRLIAGKYIDGYKAVGAGCGDGTAFVPVPGVEFNKCKLSIHCNLDDGDRISYQDSFKQYNPDDRRAYNYGSQDVDLATTDGYISFDNHEYDCWSEAHGCWIDQEDAYYVETRDDYYYDYECVYANIYDNVRGRWCEETCHQDDCVEIDGAWYYVDGDPDNAASWGVYKCPECGEYFTNKDGNYCYSEMLGETYCCWDCKNAAEEYSIDDYDGWIMTEDDGAYLRDDCWEAWKFDYFDGKYQWHTVYFSTEWEIANVCGFDVCKRDAKRFYNDMIVPMAA